MLFEIRQSVPDVSPEWIESRDRFLAGEARAAREAANGIKGKAKPRRAEDYVLLIEIARACGKVKPYLALVRAAMRVFPDDPFVRLYWSRALLTRGRHLQAIREMEALEPTLGAAMPGTWAAQLGNLWADCGFEKTSRKWMERAEKYPDEFESPLGLYTRACAAEGLRRWEESAELGRRLVEAAPMWTRARSLVIHCLLAQGRIEEAQQLVADGQKLGHEEAYFEFEAAMLDFSLGRFDQAHAAFDALRERWPEADFAPYVRRTLCILLIEAGRVEEARTVAAGEEQQFGLPPIAEGVVSGRRAFLPMPLIAQAKNQCVPCVAAMALWPRGKRIDPEQAFREMKGREGTSLWRMRAWAKEQGLACVPVRLEAEATRTLLDRGVPLIGTLEGLFNSHVDVICGYHEGLQTFYVRDPMHWAPLAFPSELALERYRLHGATLALIDEQDQETLAIANGFRSDEGEALLDLHQATAEGNREAAEAAHARIPDGSDCDYLRDVMGMHVTISPTQFAESIERWTKPEEKRGLVRFRALLTRSGDDLDAFLRDLNDEERERLGEGGRRYLRMTSQVRRGEWRDALRRIDGMLETGCGLPDLWELRSDVLAELGDEAGSREALDRALELEPMRMRLREKLLNRSADRLTYAEYLQEFDRLLEDDPDDKRLLQARAFALADGPDGKAYEAALRETLVWFPREPQNYARLLSWYSVQERPDLENRLLDRARALMPQEFPAPDGADGKSAAVGAVTPEEIRVAADAAEAMKALQEAVGSSAAIASPEAGRDGGATVGADTVAASELDVRVSDVPAVGAVAPPPSERSEEPALAALPADGEGSAASQGSDTSGSAGALPTESSALLDIAGNASDAHRDDALAALGTLEKEGKLLWHERARLMAARVLRYGDDASWSAADRGPLFPLPTPGAPNWFVGYSYSLLTDGSPAPRAALAAIRWGEQAIDDYRAHVGIWFDRVLLFEKAHDLERARRELDELLVRYPAHSSALYRMGVIEQQQGDLASALDYFQRALKINPGLYGALRLRKTICEQLDRNDDALDAAWALLKKFPYAMSSLKDLASAAYAAKGQAEAFKILEEKQADFDATELALYRARLHLFAGDKEAARKTVEAITDPQSLRDDAYEDYLRTRLQIADAEGNEAAALEVIRAGLARFADSTVLHEMLAARLAEKDPAEAKRTLEWVLLEGEPRYATANQYLETFPPPQSPVAIAIVERAPADRQEMLAELFGVVIASSYLQEAEAFHDWALSKFPQAEGVRQRLIVHLDMLGKTDRAIELAEEGLRQRPEDPNAQRLLGRTLIVKDAARGAKLLEEASAKNRDVDTLFDLARCYSMLQRSGEALSAYREILEQNPYQAAAWTNLYLAGEPPAKLFPYLEPMFVRGVGAEDEYFLVASVMLALKLKRRLPASWYGVALQRREVLKTMPGFGNERAELRNAMLAWEAKRPQDLDGVERTPGNWFQKLLARWEWPGTRWVPKE